MKKLILILVLALLFLTDKSFSKQPIFGIGLEYSYFNEHNQVMASVFKPNWFPIGSSNLNLFNISLGLRNINVLNTELLYNIYFIKGDYYIVIPLDKHSDNARLQTDNFDYGFWNYYCGVTILNFDNSKIENLFVQLINFSVGLASNSYNSQKSKDFNIEAVLAPKLGLSTFCFGNENFSNFNNNKKNHPAIESGLKFMLGFSFKRDIFIKANQDYTLFVTDQMINKLSSEVTFEYFYDIPNIKCEDCYYGPLKFSVGVSYNKYYFEDKSKEFLKYDFSIKYIIPN